MLVSVEQESPYFDLEGNEIVFKDQKWRYVNPPVVDCNIPYHAFIQYIRENADIRFINDEEAFRYGSYKLPHMDVCPPIDYSPVVFPINAEYEFKANWDSLKIGMSQKTVRKWFRFNPNLTYQKNDRNIWTYYGFGDLEFDENGKLIQWTFKGSDNHTIYKNEAVIDLHKLRDPQEETSWYNNIWEKIKNLFPN